MVHFFNIHYQSFQDRTKNKKKTTIKKMKEKKHQKAQFQYIKIKYYICNINIQTNKL